MGMPATTESAKQPGVVDGRYDLRNSSMIPALWSLRLTATAAAIGALGWGNDLNASFKAVPREAVPSEPGQVVQTQERQGLDYRPNPDGSLTIVGYRGSESNLHIPALINGCQVTAIGPEAFRGNSELKAVVIPDSVSRIDELAFFGSNLTSIEVAPGNEKFKSMDGVVFNQKQTVLMFFPPARAGEYTVPDGVTAIKRMACTGSALEAVTIPASVDQVNLRAFADCPNLLTVKFLGRPPELGNNVFAGSDQVVVEHASRRGWLGLSYIQRQFGERPLQLAGK